MKTLALLIAFAPLAFAAPVPMELKKSEAQRFEGRWWESGFDNTVYPDQDRARRFAFDGQGGLTIADNATAVPNDYKLTFDPTTNPPSFAFANIDGHVAFYGVYRLEADTLRFALTSTDKPRAKEAKPGAGLVFYELRRVK